MHLLDTDTLTHLHAGNVRVLARLERLDDPVVGITIITKIELLRGRIEFLLKAANGEETLRAQSLYERTEVLLGDVLVIPFSPDAAKRFEQLRVASNTRALGRADLLIASIALTHRATLVTRNLRHFRRVPGLSFENWVD